MSPANLEVRDGEVKMFYAASGGPPWHGLGTEVEGVLTSEEAIAVAGLDWEVVLNPLYAGPTKKASVKVPNRLAIQRDIDGTTYGFVSNRYLPLQNREAFAFLDSLVQDRVLQYETAGALFDGRRVWMLASLTEEMELKINGERYARYMLLTTGHDGLNAVHITPTTVRAVCDNTVQMALGEGQAHKDTFFRIVHNLSLREKMKLAKQALEITVSETARLKEFLEHAQTVKVSAEQLSTVQDEIFGSLDEKSSKRRQGAIETFQAIYAAEVALNGETAYSLVNAVTGYTDHARSYQGTSDERAERRFESLTSTWGSGRLFKAAGMKAVQEILS